MNESTDTTRLPTCPECGSSRNPNAVPYLALDHAMAEYTCAVCGARFESWPTAEAQGHGHPSERAARRGEPA